jgi:hypothetical protein
VDGCQVQHRISLGWGILARIGLRPTPSGGAIEGGGRARK